MDFYKKTTLELFDNSQKTFIIPVYQRAYSWEKEQWNSFFNDLLEQLDGNNNYFYGNILLETIKKATIYEIIDGQQRLTTLSILIRSIINILNKRKEEGAILPDDIELDVKETIFLKNRGNIKLRPVEYDRACYDSVIIENNENFITNSISQKRIISAKKYFETELDNLSTETVLKLLNKLETTDITVIELVGKKDSALIFELENNRGKDLTNMEKLKSYFMYQMYVHSTPEETEINIEYISNFFKLIYLIINDLRQLNEDSILIYHNNAYIKAYNYRTIDDVKEVLKKSDDKIKWIKEYVFELHTTFSNMKQFELLNDKYANKLRTLNIPAYIYPFIIKGYKHIGKEQEKLSLLFKILEIITFRAKLINSRANIQERLNNILLQFNGNLVSLNNEVRNKLNEAWYWGDDNMKHYLNGNMYGNNVLNYLLWEYEDFIQNKGYSIQNFMLEEEQIEHISPQKLNDQNIASGYNVSNENEYPEEFITKYLHCLGNLMLISGSHNASIGNRAFKEKLNSYNKNPLLNQQAEIKEFCSDSKWKMENISERHYKILTFSIERWAFPIFE
ncbi:DUF262 domain-containing protein [Elizabethkingia bruuniana]|uniref:DUF262 domain-containing protein n=1 Tax=Elizabethkingia bruuniana TaxID=1756149 RepID=UPI000999F223|nr:DUF262 domain-containing protein [Elizabethkingia bruuniana]OPC59295.1 hypothetical protein BAY07_03260 [Elizabethkingia bruuniana]